jgi:hypothetical protein
MHNLKKKCRKTERMFEKVEKEKKRRRERCSIGTHLSYGFMPHMWAAEFTNQVT